ncbi:hypothetical protein [Enterobacter hormaechei]|uniref:hypothetical protein n=1 Tax=Enterobacter hormaechei TaxID=158836 RepID=UPI001D0F695E|nr:hypothetical protein [Enterobacter hormaechei]UDV72613.1 hypothetical protein LJU35_20520 [Enterobacter hormaechei]
MKKINALHGQGFAHPVASQHDISANRKQVISGDWSPINRGEFTLADLGLRHNGNGLVWLRSGVSVHEADHDVGISGKDKTKRRVNGLPFEFVASGRNTRLNAALPFQYLRNYAASITRTMPLLVRRCVRRVISPCAPVN